jgi:hypothetical protein
VSAFSQDDALLSSLNYSRFLYDDDDDEERKRKEGEKRERFKSKTMQAMEENMCVMRKMTRNFR